MKKLSRRIIKQKIAKVANTPKEWTGKVWYGEYRSNDAVQNVRYTLFCRISREEGEFAFLEGEEDFYTRTMKLYIARSLLEKEVNNNEPLPSRIISSRNHVEVENYAKHRGSSRKVPDFAEKVEIELKDLPKEIVRKLDEIARSFYQSYL